MFNILQITTDKNMSFKLYRYLYNLRSCFILSIIDLIYCISVILLNHLKIISIEAPFYLIVLAIFLFLWISTYLFFHCARNNNSIKLAKFLFWAYLYPSFFLHALIGFSHKEIVLAFGTYPLLVLAISLFIVLNTLESIILYISTAIILIIHLVLKVSHTPILNALFLNIILTNIITFIFSIIKSTSSYSMYNTHQLLINTIDARDEANEKLKIHEKYITDFFINISHDLKAPLNIIYSSQQLLEKQISNRDIDYEKAKKYITSIKLNSIRLTRLLNNVLDISKIDASKYILNLRNLDIVTTIEGITDSLVDFMSSKGITLTFDTDFEEMILALDEEKVERIILNLLSNALKFTPHDGTISLKLYEDKNFVFVSIQDTGIGIHNDYQKDIFDRFTQGTALPTNHMSGSGIGLSLVKSLMILHGGDVSLESKLGKGSNFILKFPKTTIKETLAEDIAKGAIYPHSNSTASTNLEFVGLVNEKKSL